MAGVNLLGSIDLGKVTDWNDNKTAIITPISFPGQDSGQTQGIDTLGVVALIKMRGRITGNFLDLQNTLYDIKNIADGNQTSALNLYSPFICFNEGTTDAKVRRRGNIGTNSGSGTTLTDSNAAFDTWGIQVGDYVKNIQTGTTTNVSAVSTTTLTLSANIFATTGLNYAVTANIPVKVTSVDIRWGLPGLNYVDYTLELMQVKS